MSTKEEERTIADCGCSHIPCPCEELDCPYYGATCNLCSVHAAAPALLAALEQLMWIADAAWRNAIMATDAPMPAKLAKVEEGSPEAKQARAAIKQAKGDS